MMAFTCVLSLISTSCSSDDDDTLPKPTVTLTEVGHNNSKHAHPGHDLHLEADIMAEGLLKFIDIKIHQEGGGDFLIAKSFTTGNYIGVKNTEFHEHIEIPADAPLGEYHLHFYVTDQQGQQTLAESQLELVEADGEEEEEEEEHHHHDE